MFLLCYVDGEAIQQEDDKCASASLGVMAMRFHARIPQPHEKHSAGAVAFGAISSAISDAPVPRRKPIGTIDGPRLPFGWRWGGGDIGKAVGLPNRRHISKAMGFPDRRRISEVMGFSDRHRIPRRVS